MPTTTIVFDNELLTSVAVRLAKEVVDQLDQAMPLLAFLEEGMESQSGGDLYEEPAEIAEHSRTTQLTNGYEPLDYTVQGVLAPFVDHWADAIRPVVISGRDQRINTGEGKVLDLVKTYTRNSIAGLRRELDRRLHGLATGVVLSDWCSLNGDDIATGFLEMAAVGAQNNVVHGLSKATYANLPGMQNQRADCAGSFSANGLVSLQNFLAAVRVVDPPDPSKARFFASVLAAGHLTRAVGTNETYVNVKELAGGHICTSFGGYAVEVDPHMPNAGTSTTANPWSFLFVDKRYIRIIKNANNWFRTGSFTEQSGYDCTAMPIHLMAQLRAKKFGSSGVIVDAEVW